MSEAASPKTYNVSQQVPPRLTVEECVQWCLQNQLDPEVVMISGGHFLYERTETAEEMTERLKRQAASEERHREWVKGQYHRLWPDGDR